MPERRRPEMDHTREMLRRHDERPKDEPEERREPDEAAEQPEGDAGRSDPAGDPQDGPGRDDADDPA